MSCNMMILNIYIYIYIYICICIYHISRAALELVEGNQLRTRRSKWVCVEMDDPQNGYIWNSTESNGSGRLIFEHTQLCRSKPQACPTPFRVDSISSEGALRKEKKNISRVSRNAGCGRADFGFYQHDKGLRRPSVALPKWVL